MAEENIQKAQETNADASVSKPLNAQAAQAQNEKSDVGPDILQSIVDIESNKDNSENLLDLAPDMDESLLQGLEPQKNIHLMLFKSTFMFLLVFGLLAILFFQMHLNPKFEFLTSTFNITSATEKLDQTNEEVLNTQTDLNFYNFLQLNAYLNEFSFYGDAYIQYFEILDSQTASEEDKKLAKENLKSLRAYITEPYLKILEISEKSVYIPIIDPDLMKNGGHVQEFDNRLNLKFSEISASLEEEQEAKAYIQSQKLIGNSELKNILKDKDIETLSDLDLYNHIKEINEVIVNDLSLIQEIKDKRIKWSDIMNEIEQKTKEVDLNYSEDQYELRGGIRYTSYDFDQSANRISIVGEIMRFDTTNFTMIANLIDAFNTSNIFEGAEMKSFSKSGSLDDGYKSNVRLNLGLTKLNNAENTN